MIDPSACHRWQPDRAANLLSMPLLHRGMGRDRRKHHKPYFNRKVEPQQNAYVERFN
jgi:hypothetical protein